MGNILTFPDRCDAVDSQEFLQDGDDTLWFDSPSEKKKDGKYAFPLPKQSTSLKTQGRAKDWTNQELAHLYRVKRLLDLAGVSNTIDRGLTDEGDPWFLFCDATDEVFIHLCRIDGVYILDNPSIETPLRGQDFSHLVNAFLERKLKTTSEHSLEDKHKVVRLARNNKVFLHPSTMLAALVWTLFLESDELVMVLPKDTAEPGNPLDTRTAVSSPSDQDTTLYVPSLQKGSLNLDDESGRNTADSMPISHHLRDMLAGSDTKSGQYTYVIGLSVIAISLGIISESEMSDIDDVTLENILALLGDAEGAEDPGTDAMSEFSFTADGILNFITALEHAFGDPTLADAQPGEEASDPAMNGHISATLLTDINAALDVVMGKGVEHENDQIPQGKTLSGKAADQTLLANETGNLNQDSKPSQPSSTGQDSDQLSFLLTKLHNIDTGGSFDTKSMRAYTVDSNTLYATFDISASEVEKTNSLLTKGASKTFSPEDPFLDTDFGSQPADKKAQQNADEAYKFVSYLLDKEGDLEIIALNKELVFIDPDVLDVGSLDTYVMGWELDGGETVSVIGLQSDYDVFSLIA